MNVFRFATTIEVENWMELGIEWERERKKRKKLRWADDAIIFGDDVVGLSLSLSLVQVPKPRAKHLERRKWRTK